MPAEIYSLNLDAHAGIILPDYAGLLAHRGVPASLFLLPFHGRHNRALSARDKLRLEENQAKELCACRCIVLLSFSHILRTSGRVKKKSQ